MFQDDANLEVSVCFHHFISALPNLRMASVSWHLDADGSEFQPLPSCEECYMRPDPTDTTMSNGSTAVPPSTLTTLRVRALFYDWLNDSGALPNTGTREKLARLLRQLRFSSLQAISVSVHAPSLLVAANRRIYLLSIIEACNACSLSTITEASLEIGMATDGRTPAVAISVSQRGSHRMSLCRT
jgi:hypothetical protein